MLKCIIFAPLLARLHLHVVGTRSKTALVVARKTVGDDVRIGSDLPIGETLNRLLIVGVGVGHANPAAGLRGGQNQRFCGSFSPNERLVDLSVAIERLALRT